ncbi:MAG: PAS domain S-box protein [Planctomycetota bacterium]
MSESNSPGGPRFEASAFRETLESIPGGVLHFSPSGHITDANERACEMLQLGREALLQRTAADLARMAVREDGSVCTLSEFPPQLCLDTGRSVSGVTLGLRLADHGLIWANCGVAPAPKSLKGVIATLVDVTELKRADAALRLSERRFRSMFERHDAVMLLVDYSTGAIVDANRAAERFYGWPRENMRTMFFTDINELPIEEVRAIMGRAAREQQAAYVFPQRLASGEVRQVEVHSSPIEYEEKRLLFSIVHDVTDRERLGDELRQSQKHEAIGQLSGGVAHDFNNTLTIINGYADQLRSEVGPDHPWRETLDEILAAGSRAADLTRQLLAFSRKELIQPEVFDLNELIMQFESMILRLIGEDIEVLVDLDEVACPIKADRRRIEQVLMNLAVNAKDAMPVGGQIRIRTKLEAGFAWSNSFVGPRVRLTVSDNGAGMDEQTRLRAFEPFFTTKDRGTATGLGLAAVYGTVEQADGQVRLASEPGEGTEVIISFHVSSAPLSTRRSEKPRARTATTGTETVLLVEDEEGVRNLAVRSLERRGYSVLSASRGEEAIELAKSYDGKIDLLITDVIMPGMRGPDLVETVRSIRPDIRGFYISGYAEDEVDESAARFELLPKPFTPSVLIETVRRVLQAPSEEEAGV